MEKAENNSKVAALLRLRAEELQKNKNQSKFEGKLSEVKTLKFIHELEVHQIELEMQNQELLLAKERAEHTIEKYTELYDYATSAYFTLSPDGKVIEANLTGADMLGTLHSSVLNSQFGFFVCDDTKYIFDAFLKKIFKSKGKESCEVNLITKDKKSFFCHLSGVISIDHEQCIITLIDITELKEAEFALRKIQEKFRDLLNSLAEGIIVHSPDSSIVMSNPKASELLGLS